MLKAEKIKTFGWIDVIRGMRNPMNSWDKIDSKHCTSEKCELCVNYSSANACMCGVMVGDNDLSLMKKLVNAGTDHRKFLRMITVYMDITAPLYWWKEYDTYKVGTVANSCSTMHKITAKEFTMDDFSHEHLFVNEAKSELTYLDEDTGITVTPKSLLNITVDCLNNYRMKYLKTREKIWWWQIIQLLPSSYNQKRTVMLNYEVLRNIYHARKNHKLDEWKELCAVIEALPYFKVLIA